MKTFVASWQRIGRRLPAPYSLERRRGVILFLWSLSLTRMPSLTAHAGYATLNALLSWTRHPQLFVEVIGMTTGAVQVFAEAYGIDVARRASANIAIGFWLLVASGFTSSDAAGPALVAYVGFAWLNGRTARGLPPS